ncbi:serine/threonine-protein kinase [Pedococcus sp.]|uniref:serine/threonine-protein kinase n=1 Tax=Pedococcus sp. TaxID=2860345 RepID=UPI002E10FCDB|nr:serine/threonine-protein kinase [Pedococcus sp.]
MDATDPMPPPDVPGYRLGEHLGTGATGTVWAALRSRDLLPVAVKVVPVGAHVKPVDQAGDQPVDEPGGHAARELAVLGRVSVEGLVGFHEAIGLHTDPPSLALVLDHVAGGSLWSAVRARGHLSVGESVTVLVPVARALAGLHAMGVVHGDVSPRNVLLQRSGRPVLSDLGVAQVAGVSDAQTYGTTGFVAPELEDGSPRTAASDVYAVGALGWWCVTGELPTPASLRQPLDALAPGLPESWRAVTAQALSRDPADRPTAAELALAYFDSAPCEPLRLVVGADDTSLLTHRLRRSQPAPPAASRAAARVRGRPRLRWLLVGAAVMTALGLAVAGVAFADHLPWRIPPHPSAVPQRPRTLVSVTPRDLTTDPAAARRDPVGLMQALADRRARTMTSRVPAELESLDVTGSVAMRDDAALLRDLAAHHRSYRDVAFRVRSARYVECTATTAQIDAAVDTTAYTVDDAGGVVRHERLPPAPVVRFSLRWQDAGWRIEEVSAP